MTKPTGALAAVTLVLYTIGVVMIIDAGRPFGSSVELLLAWTAVALGTISLIVTLAVAAVVAAINHQSLYLASQRVTGR